MVARPVEQNTGQPCVAAPTRMDFVEGITTPPPNFWNTSPLKRSRSKRFCRRDEACLVRHKHAPENMLLPQCPEAEG